MCGIAGFWGQGDRDDLDWMVDAVAHRGPDGVGEWTSSEDRVFLGHRRLSIIDLECGAQPMATSDNDIVVTFNGEIYNHDTLRHQLEELGHRFVTDHSDTEVLLHGYRQWGHAMVNRLNGMWAFAIFDRPKQLLFLSRDRFGEKPLFYFARSGLFAFGSELTAVTRHRSVRAAISERALQKYFAYGYIPAPYSLYDGIHKLPAGSSVTFHLPDQKMRQVKYWEYLVDPFATIPAHPEGEWGDELVRLLRRSVKLRLMADVELGIFLSGGIDSAAIAALAAQESSSPVSTFSVGFHEPSFDESHHAELVARTIGSKHHTERLSLDRSADLLPDIAAGLDEPIGDSSLLPTWLVSRMAREKVKVALGGDGGDELFAGYDPFDALLRANHYSRLVPKPMHQAIRLMVGALPVSHTYMSLSFKVKRTLTGLGHPQRLWNPIWMAPLPPVELNDLFGKLLDVEDLYSEAIEAWDQCPQDNLVDRTSQFFIQLYLQNDILAKTDRASMAHGLEVRAPFLDVDLVDFVRRIPWRYKYHRGERKHLLKRAVTGLIPSSIIGRKKQGFGAPVGRWFHEGKLQLDPDLEQGYLNRQVAFRYQKAHQLGREDHRLFLFSYWLLQNLDLQRAYSRL